MNQIDRAWLVSGFLTLIVAQLYDGIFESTVVGLFIALTIGYIGKLYLMSGGE